MHSFFSNVYIEFTLEKLVNQASTTSRTDQRKNIKRGTLFSVWLCSSCGPEWYRTVRVNVAVVLDTKWNELGKLDLSNWMFC